MKVKRLTETAKLPTKAHPGDLGFDLYSNVSMFIKKGDAGLIPTGIAVEFPYGIGGIIKDRSSMAAIGVVSSGGVIDSQYRGEIMIVLRNLSNGARFIEAGQKVAQLILVTVINEEIEETTEPFLQTIRGGKGFGSSGS